MFSMYMLTRTCKVLPKVIRAVQRATTVVELRHDISVSHRRRLDGFPTRLCTSLAEENNILCLDKTPANTKEEQLSYVRKPIRDIGLYINDSCTDDDDSDYCERFEEKLKAIALAEEEIQIEKEILANYKEEAIFCYNPSIKYEPLKRYAVPRVVLSEDSSSDWSDSESDSQNETMAEEEAQTQKYNFLAATKEEQLSHYDLAKSPMSTDLQSVTENLAVSPSTELQSTPAVPDSSVLSEQVKHGAKSPAEGGIKDLKLAKEMDICIGLLEKVATDDQNKSGTARADLIVELEQWKF